MPENGVVIVGGGVIGLSIGWKLARAGQDVTVVERGEAGRGTSWAAAGMLAPAVEIGFEELELYRLGHESLTRWPAFARALEEESGIRIDYRDEGTLVVADDRDSAEALRRLYAFQKEHDLPVEWLTGTQALDLEPMLAPRLTAAIFSPTDHQLDNRLLVQALKQALIGAGGHLLEDAKVKAVLPDAQEPHVVLDDGTERCGGVVVVAAGVWSQQIGGLAPHEPPLRPVKGQMVEVRMQAPFRLNHVVRGPQAYLAPKSSGRLVIGATSEEMGFDTTVTAGGLFSLLEGAWEIVPGIWDLPVTDTWAGLRPASRDHAPLIGWSGVPGVMYATGHYRHGILLTPITAEAITHLILTGETPATVESFAPQRFQSTV